MAEECIWCKKMEKKWQEFKLPEELASNPILQEYHKNIKEKSHKEVHLKLKEYEEELIDEQNYRRSRAASLPSGIDVTIVEPDIHIGAPEED